MARFAAIGIDADDTLWHNESLYQEAQTALVGLLKGHGEEAETRARLLETERRNVEFYGYGIKSFVLSMIEVAVGTYDDVVPGVVLQAILDLGRTMLEAPVELLPGVEIALGHLASTHELWLITKGDLRDQRVKLERSGLEALFSHVDIVVDKTPSMYGDLLRRRGVSPSRFAMIGNSPRSDIEPVVAVGATAILVPYHLLWEHEDGTEKAGDEPRLHTVGSFSDVPRLVEQLEKCGQAGM